MTARQKREFINELRNSARNMIHNVNELNRLLKEYQALDYGNAETGLVQGDMIDENANISIDCITNMVSSIEALNTWLSTGYYTNLCMLR